MLSPEQDNDFEIADTTSDTECELKFTPPTHNNGFPLVKTENDYLEEVDADPDPFLTQVRLHSDNDQEDNDDDEWRPGGGNKRSSRPKRTRNTPKKFLFIETKKPSLSRRGKRETRTPKISDKLPKTSKEEPPKRRPRKSPAHKEKKTCDSAAKKVKSSKIEKTKRNTNSTTTSSDKSKPPSDSTSSRPSRRKNLSEMTPEEREAQKQQWREEARLRRQQRREQMTPAEREAYLSRERERTRAKRAEKKADPTIREELQRKDRERKVLKRAMRTPEQRAEDNQRQSLRRLMKKVSMTDADKEQLKQAECLKKLAKLAEKTQEELEMEMKARRERKRFYWATMAEDKKKQIGQKQRERRIAKLLEKGITPAGKRGRRMPPNETEEERIARRKRLRAESQRRTMIRRRIAIEKLLDSGVPPDKLFNLEKRKTAVIQDRVKRAKKRLRSRLEKKGVPPDKIQEELEVVEKSRKETEVRPYQPKRERVANRLHPEEYQRFKDEVEKNPHPQSKYAKLAANPELILEGKVDLLATSSLTPPPHLRRKSRAAPKQTAITQKVDIPQEVPAQVPEEIPTAASSCSYISVVTSTPVVLAPTTTIQYHYQTSSIYQDQNIATYQQEPSISHDEPQTQTFTLQQVFDPVTFQPIMDHHSSTTSDNPSFNMFVQFQPTFEASSFPDNNGGSVSGDDNPYSSPQDTPVVVEVVQDNHTAAPISTSEVPPLLPPPPLPKVVGTEEISSSSSSAPRKRGKAPERGVPRGPNKRTDLSTAIPCDICGLLYKQRYMFDHKQRFHNPHFENGKCLLCGETFSRARHFVKHFHVVHKGAARGPNRSGGPLSRKPKNPNSSSSDNLQNGGTSNREAVCDICGNSYTPHYLRVHKLAVHNPHFKDGQCLICGEFFKQTRHFLPHYNKMHREKVDRVPPVDAGKSAMCEICGWSFRTNSELLRHHREKHTNCPKQMIRCPYCPEEKLLAKTGLRSHYMNVHPEHLVKNIPKCGRCGKEFEKDSELAEHYKVDHNGAYLTCRFCNNVVHTKIGLFYHFVKCIRAPKTKVYELMEAEGTETLFLARAKIPCEFCEHKMVISSLSRHYHEIHGVKNDKQFECWRCTKKFIRRDRWAFHMIDYHGEEWGVELIERLSKLWTNSKEEIQVENQMGLNKHTARYFERIKSWPEGKRLPQRKYKTRKTEEIHQKFLKKVISSPRGDKEEGQGQAKRKRGPRSSKYGTRAAARKSSKVKASKNTVHNYVENNKRLVILVERLTQTELNRCRDDKPEGEEDVKPF